MYSFLITNIFDLIPNTPPENPATPQEKKNNHTNSLNHSIILLLFFLFANGYKASWDTKETTSTAWFYLSAFLWKWRIIKYLYLCSFFLLLLLLLLCLGITYPYFVKTVRCHGIVINDCIVFRNQIRLV